MGSDESHFNVSLIVRGKVTRQCPQTTLFLEVGEIYYIDYIEIDYIPIATLSTRMIPALRWAAMRAILMFQ